MRTSSRLLSICLLLGSALVLAAPPEPANPPGTTGLPPPPGMNDPGVSAGALPPGVTVGGAAPAGQNGAPLAEMNDQDAANEDPLAALPKPDTRLVRDKSTRDTAATNERIASSQVTTRKQGNDTVEEYRQNGHVWMIRIVQPNGPTQTFMDPDGSGKLYRDPQQGPVSPVYFSLYEWN
jgi:hypothetical protein